MAFSFSVYNHIQQLPDTWHRIADKHKSFSSTKIGVQDLANIENLTSYYLMVSKNDEIIFIAYYQLLFVKPIHFNLGNKKVQQFFLDLALKIVKPTLLVAGDLFRHDENFFHFELEVTPEERAKIYQDALNFMIAHTNASGIFLKDIPADIAKGIQDDPSYIAMQDDISMEMKIPEHWKSLSDYEKDLKHKYLQRSKKMRKAFTGVRIQDLKKYAIDIYKLYAQVTQKQIVRMGLLNEAFFLKLKDAFKKHYRVCGFFLDDQLIAFSSAIIHDTVYDMNYIGIDYTYNQSHHLYFNILFHCLESAIETNASTLILGRTALEAKAIMGCTPDYRFSFYKLRNVIVNWFFQRVSAYFSESQGDKWKERHPFKSSFYH